MSGIPAQGQGFYEPLLTLVVHALELTTRHNVFAAWIPR